MRLARHGIAVRLPRGWDARVFRHAVEHGATTNPVMHAANFPLPENRGDFGSGAVDRMTAEDVFVTLFEYDPEAAGTPMFARRGRPRPQPGDFSPGQLQRTLRGQSGAQYFFTEADRAFCLYVVLGSHANRARLLPRVHELVDALELPPRSA